MYDCTGLTPQELRLALNVDTWDWMLVYQPEAAKSMLDTYVEILERWN